MNLPNFFYFEPMNRLRELIGLEADEFGVGPVASVYDSLRSRDGGDVEIDLKDLKFLLDGTLGCEDNRIILYIKDATVHEGKLVEPKYHVSNCKTLQNMQAEGRIERYVATTRLDDEFELSFTLKGKKKTQYRRLSVCQNCLSNISYKGFNKNLSSQTRKQMVNEFSVRQFFNIYPRFLYAVKPLHVVANAASNDYSHDWREVSRALKQSVDWKCQIQRSIFCVGDYSKIEYRQYLYAHHKNSVRSDNRPDNLIAVCVACYAEEASYSYLKDDPQYESFMRDRERNAAHPQARKPASLSRR